jgi:hypothetical protein
MLWQQQFKGEHGKEPQTARDVAKECLRSYVLLDWTFEDILTAFTRARGMNWGAQIGGVVEEDDQGQQQIVGREQIAVTQLGNRPCFAVYDIAELIAEIRREAGLEDAAPATSQQDQDHGSREEKDDAREAVKAIVRLFLDDGTSEEEIIAMVGPAATGNWRIQMGGEVIDQGELRALHRQIAAIGPGRLYWAIFEVAEVIAELRREEELRAAAEPPPAPAIQEEAERCRYCGSAVEVNKARAGRMRHYCNDTCRVADYRRRKRDSHSAALVQEQHEHLQEMWKDPRISSQCFTRLYNLFVHYGPEAAHVATEAVLFYGNSEQGKRQPDEPEQASVQGCLFCGKLLAVKTGAGRRRHYCNERCRVADYRRREATARRAAILQQSQELRHLWQEHHIGGQSLALLQSILVEHGEEAARAATETLFLVIQEQTPHTVRTSRPATRRRKHR